MRSVAAKISFVFLSAALFSSCKKNVVFNDITINTFRPIVEFSDVSGFKSVAMDYTNNQITVDITDVRFMIRSDISKESSVKVAISTNVVNDYNADNGTNYTPVGVPLFSLENDLFTLSPSERSQPVRIRIKPSDVAVGENAIGLTIFEVTNGEISQIAGKLVIALSVKNQYDGIYTLDGAFYHPTSSPGYDPFTIEVEMHTTGPNSVKMYVPDFGGYYHPGLFGGVLNAFGSQEPEYTVSPATNTVTVQNAFPGAVTFYTMAPGFNSRYDAATKTIYAKFGYNYSPGPTFNPATNREWTDVLTYIGPR
ncbi:MAG: DUF1735 domain-containing protein [Chitinophagaceae bacterium]|nr:DUF1735 domain-containing protein [Chitinophagaceae bacterium]